MDHVDDWNDMMCFEYEFASGVSGTAYHKKQPSWKVGDEVDFEITGVNAKTQKPKLRVRAVGSQGGRAPQPASRSLPQQEPPDFHKEMKKLSLFWCHCFQYVADIESHIGELTADQRQSAIASLFIEGNKHGLSQNPPALRKVENSDPF